MNVINLEEKLSLAKQLNLKKQISYLKYKKGMFDLKFKPINLKDIHKRLLHRRLRIKSGTIYFSIFSIIVPIFFWVMGYTELMKNQNEGVVLAIFFLLVFSFISLVTSCVLASIESTHIENRLVENFNEEIPYGAMLALKEAREKGIVKHRVFYPVWESSTTIAEDPIIVGENPRGELVEIFAWNEDDVYEN